MKMLNWMTCVPLGIAILGAAGANAATPVDKSTLNSFVGTTTRAPVSGDPGFWTLQASGVFKGDGILESAATSGSIQFRIPEIAISGKKQAVSKWSVQCAKVEGPFLTAITRLDRAGEDKYGLFTPGQWFAVVSYDGGDVDDFAFVQIVDPHLDGYPDTCDDESYITTITSYGYESMPLLEFANHFEIVYEGTGILNQDLVPANND